MVGSEFMDVCRWPIEWPGSSTMVSRGRQVSSACISVTCAGASIPIISESGRMLTMRRIETQKDGRRVVNEVARAGILKPCGGSVNTMEMRA